MTTTFAASTRRHGRFHVVVRDRRVDAMGAVRCRERCEGGGGHPGRYRRVDCAGEWQWHRLGSGTNELILNGGSADIESELKSRLVTETATGPDTIDIEVFGANGHLGNFQSISLALPTSFNSSAETYSFVPASAAYGWTSSSASVSQNDIINSETLVWIGTNQNPSTGQYQQTKTTKFMSHSLSPASLSSMVPI